MSEAVLAPLAERLRGLPPDGARALAAAIARAQARSKTTGGCAVLLTVVFEVGANGIHAVELPERYETRS